MKIRKLRQRRKAVDCGYVVLGEGKLWSCTHQRVIKDTLMDDIKWKWLAYTRWQCLRGMKK